MLGRCSQRSVHSRVSLVSRIIARVSDDVPNAEERVVATNHRDEHAWRRASVGRIAVAMFLAAALAGCAYHNDGPIDGHYQRYKAGMPDGDKVFVCSSYGCRTQTPFKFTAADIAEVK